MSDTTNRVNYGARLPDHPSLLLARPWPTDTQAAKPDTKETAESIRKGIEVACFADLPPSAQTSGGGKLSGAHYYRVEVRAPISPELGPYSAECADIIEALGMTFNEGEAFKAIWRLAAARQGRVKSTGAGPQYDADKAAHYGARVAAQTRAV
jgi:hypothetical protein